MIEKGKQLLTETFHVFDADGTDRLGDALAPRFGDGVHVKDFGCHGVDLVGCFWAFDCRTN
jgi:hypothetical protein